MARRAPEPPPAEIEEIEDDPGDLDEQVDPFLTALESLAGVDNAHIAVYRRERGNQQWEGNLSLEEFSLETVRSTWGGGKYDFRLIRGNKYVKGRTVIIAGPPKPSTTVESPEDRDERRDAEVSHKRARLSDTSAMEAIMELRDDLRGFLRDVRNPPPEAANANPMLMAMELAKTMAAMMTPYLEMIQGGGGGGRGGGGSDLDPMELIRMGMELKGGGGEDGYGRVMKELGFPLFKMLQAQGMAEGLNPGQEGGAVAEPEPGNALDALRGWVPTLVNWAVSGRDPRLRADFIADELPSRYSDMLERFVSTPDALTAFFTRYPETMAHRPWFEELFQGLFYAYGGDEGEDGNETSGGIEVVPD